MPQGRTSVRRRKSRFQRVHDLRVRRPEAVAEGASHHAFGQPPIHQTPGGGDQPAIIDARLEHRLGAVWVAADAAFLLDRQRQQRRMPAQVSVIVDERLDHPGAQLALLIRAEAARRQKDHLRPGRRLSGGRRLSRGIRRWGWAQQVRR